MENSPWSSLLLDYKAGEYQIVPLISRKQLRREAKAMSHCVDQYAGLCRAGVARVFSIRDSGGKRLATLSLHQRNDWWDLGQCYGYENCEVLSYFSDFDSETETMDLECFTDIYYIASDVEARYNKLCRRSQV